MTSPISPPPDGWRWPPVDVVSRTWITTLVSAEESSVQVKVAHTAALAAEDLLTAADARATTTLREALAVRGP